jgi:hypothetical protein
MHIRSQAVFLKPLFNVENNYQFVFTLYKVCTDKPVPLFRVTCVYVCMCVCVCARARA